MRVGVSAFSMLRHMGTRVHLRRPQHLHPVGAKRVHPRAQMHVHTTRLQGVHKARTHACIVRGQNSGRR